MNARKQRNVDCSKRTLHSLNLINRVALSVTMFTVYQRNLGSAVIVALFAVFSIDMQLSPTKYPRATFFITELIYPSLLSIRSQTMKCVRDEANVEQHFEKLNYVPTSVASSTNLQIPPPCSYLKKKAGNRKLPRQTPQKIGIDDPCCVRHQEPAPNMQEPRDESATTKGGKRSKNY